MISPDATITRKERVVYRDLQDGGVLLDLESGAYFGVNAVGSLVWAAIDGGRTVDGVVADLRSQLDDAPPGVADDVVHFLSDLEARGLVRA